MKKIFRFVVIAVLIIGFAGACYRHEEQEGRHVLLETLQREDKAYEQDIIKTEIEEKDAKLIEWPQAFKELDSPNWQDRSEVLNEVLYGQLEIPSELKDKFIELIKEESVFEEKFVKNWIKTGLSEHEARVYFIQKYYKDGYMQYYSELSAVVSSFKDVRVVPFLLKGIYYGGGAVVPTHVINIGEGAVNPLFDAMRSDDMLMKRESVFVFSVWVNPPRDSDDYGVSEEMLITDSETLEKIKTAFLEALGDSDERVRVHAVYGLGAFPEDIVISRLEEIAKNDPDYSELFPSSSVRGLAVEILKQLKEKRKSLPEGKTKKLEE
ncbi:MAG: hypothetical protein KAS88_02395 [Deltaproteobacteria bacterium]|nr:hypothetical protein [Deltaproteobacteria bacterium]